MASIQRFEDIEAWKMARALTNRIYELTAKSSRVISGLIKYLRQSQLTGKKYKVATS